jgi:hypothetical protein
MIIIGEGPGFDPGLFVLGRNAVTRIRPQPQARTVEKTTCAVQINSKSVEKYPIENNSRG